MAEDAGFVRATAQIKTPAALPVKVPARRDELGRPVEFVEVADREAASMWDARGWRPLR